MGAEHRAGVAGEIDDRERHAKAAATAAGTLVHAQILRFAVKNKSAETAHFVVASIAPAKSAASRAKSGVALRQHARQRKSSGVRVAAVGDQPAKSVASAAASSGFTRMADSPGRVSGIARGGSNGRQAVGNRLRIGHAVAFETRRQHEKVGRAIKFCEARGLRRRATQFGLSA